MAILLQWIIKWPDDGLPGRIVVDVRQVFRQRAAADGQAVTMQEPGIEQALHQRLDAADGHQFRHCVMAAGAKVGEHRRALADTDEIIEGQRNSRFMGDRQQVQDGIGRAADGDHHGDRILESLARQDVRRTNAPAHQLDHRGAGPPGIVMLVARDGVLARAVRQAEPHGLDRRSHGVGGVHAAAGAGTGNRRSLHVQQFGFAHVAARHGSHGLEHRDDVPPLGTGLDRAAVDEDRGAIQARHGHGATRHVLVATTDGHESIEALGRHDCFDRVGDDLARRQGIVHARRAHRDAVRHGDRVEQHAFATRLVRAFDGGLRQPVNVHVAGCHHAPGGGHADLALAEILLAEPHRAQHGAARCLVDPVDHDAGIASPAITGSTAA